MAARIVALNRLPQTVTSKLRAALRGGGPVRPLLGSAQGSAGAVVGWSFLAFFGFLVLLIAWLSRYGSAGWYRQGAGGLVAYFVGLAAFAFGVLYAIRTARRASQMPRGVFLFARDLVDTRARGGVRVVPLADVIEARPASPFTLMVRFADGYWHLFSAPGYPYMQQVLMQLEGARNAPPEVLAQWDVFAEARDGAGQIAELPAPAGPSEPAWSRFAWAIALPIAVVLAAPTWLARNLLSDESAFGRAKRENEEYLYNLYLDGNGRHADEVATVLLPRVVLDEAKKEKTVPPVKKYLERFPRSRYDAEAQAALRDAYQYELDQAKGKGSVTAIREYLKTYPETPFVADARGAVHALFQKTLVDFKAQASSEDAAMMPFVEALMAYEEANDSPAIAVRFHRKTSQSLANADRMLVAAESIDPSGGGGAAASPHFDEKSSRPREAAIVRSLQTGFEKVFPTDVLRLEETSTSKSPTMDITYEVGWSGTTYHGSVSNRDFVGIAIDFDVNMQVPDAPAAKRCPPTPPKPWEHVQPEVPGALCPLAFSLSVKPPQEFTVTYDELAPEFRTQAVLGASDDRVYDVMAARAFDQLASKVKRVFFKAPADKAKGSAVAAPAAAVADDDDDDTDSDTTSL